MSCKGLRYKNRPKKRVALGKIAANRGKESTDHLSFYGCKQYDVHLCKNRDYFGVFHR